MIDGLSYSGRVPSIYERSLRGPRTFAELERELDAEYARREARRQARDLFAAAEAAEAAGDLRAAEQCLSAAIEADGRACMNNYRR